MADSLHPKIARTDHEILDVIRHRWSPRAFDASRDVGRADLRRVFEAVRWAPSSGNEQPWHFVVTDRRTTPDAFAALLGSLTPRNQAWAASAPVLILVVIRTTRESTGTVNSSAAYDAGQSVAFLTLQATATGLSTRQVKGFLPDVARTACGVPALFDPAVVIALGYAGSPDSLAIEAHREAEMQPRERRIIGDFVFEGRWGAELQ